MYNPLAGLFHAPISISNFTGSEVYYGCKDYYSNTSNIGSAEVLIVGYDKFGNYLVQSYLFG
jgi:hypothetical protein